MKHIIKHTITLSIMASAFLFLVSCESTEPEPVQEQPVIQQEQPKAETENAEYNKAISKISGEAVSLNTYEADLAAIQATIAELDAVMTKRDFQKWQTYVEPDSITYWKNPSHLAKASSLLPRKDVKVKNLMDYFNYIFIPARVDHKVEHIRYVNPNSVKAVQVKDDETEVVYYNFVKSKGKWLVQLPTID
jgi:hypothetical protein